VLGRIPSKKNMIRASSNVGLLKGRAKTKSTVAEAIDWLCGSLKVFIRNSYKYEQWIEATKPTIESQAEVWVEKFKGQGLSLPLDNVSLSLYHYWDDNMERDLDNKLTAIADLLVSAGVIKGDNWQCLRKIHSESECYKDQIVKAITRIDVTQSFD
jgi:hypothetical protein